MCCPCACWGTLQGPLCLSSWVSCCYRPAEVLPLSPLWGYPSHTLQVSDIYFLLLIKHIKNVSSVRMNVVRERPRRNSPTICCFVTQVQFYVYILSWNKCLPPGFSISKPCDRLWGYCWHDQHLVSEAPQWRWPSGVGSSKTHKKSKRPYYFNRAQSQRALQFVKKLDN